MNYQDIAQMTVNEILDMSFRDFCEFEATDEYGYSVCRVPTVGKEALIRDILRFTDCAANEVTVEVVLKYGLHKTRCARNLGRKTIDTIEERMELVGIDWNTRRTVEETPKPTPRIAELVSSAAKSDTEKHCELDARLNMLEEQIKSDIAYLFREDNIVGDSIERNYLYDQILHELATFRELEGRMRIAKYHTKQTLNQ